MEVHSQQDAITNPEREKKYLINSNVYGLEIACIFLSTLLTFFTFVIVIYVTRTLVRGVCSDFILEGRELALGMLCHGNAFSMFTWIVSLCILGVLGMCLGFPRRLQDIFERLRTQFEV